MTADNSLALFAQGLIRGLAEHSATPDTPHAARWDGDCGCRACQLNYLILVYMFVAMEPTDRVLRPAEPRD